MRIHTWLIQCIHMLPHDYTWFSQLQTFLRPGFLRIGSPQWLMSWPAWICLRLPKPLGFTSRQCLGWSVSRGTVPWSGLVHMKRMGAQISRFPSGIICGLSIFPMKIKPYKTHDIISKSAAATHFSSQVKFLPSWFPQQRLGVVPALIGKRHLHIPIYQPCDVPRKWLIFWNTML